MQACDYLFMRKLNLLAICSLIITETRMFSVSPDVCLIHLFLVMMQKLQSAMSTVSLRCADSASHPRAFVWHTFQDDLSTAVHQTTQSRRSLPLLDIIGCCSCCSSHTSFTFHVYKIVKTPAEKKGLKYSRVSLSNSTFYSVKSLFFSSINLCNLVTTSQGSRTSPHR